MNVKNLFVSVVALVSLLLPVAARAEPAPTPSQTLLAEVAAKPVLVATAMHDKTAEQRLAFARELIAHVQRMELTEAERTRILANVAAACLAAVEPAQRAAMARALVTAGGAERVGTIVAAIALAAGADVAGQEVVRSAVNAAADLSAELKAVAERASREPDAVLGRDLASEVVRTTQEVHGIVLPPPATHRPIVPPPLPPRAHPYAAQ